jgi:hypothetical protein
MYLKTPNKQAIPIINKSPTNNDLFYSQKKERATNKELGRLECLAQLVRGSPLPFR